MIFNDTSTKNGLIQDCERWLFGGDYGAISGNTKNLLTFTSLLNYGLDKTALKIFEVDNRWKFDNAEHSDYPYATTNLVSGTQNYELEDTFLKVEGFECLDESGNAYPLINIDDRAIRTDGQAISEFMDENGQPTYYKLKGDIVTLFPASNYNSTNGLKVIYQRSQSHFVSTDTTKTTGMPAELSDLPVLYACQKYAKQNSMTEKARELDAEVQKCEKDVENFINRRLKDYKPVIRAKYNSPE